MQGCETVQLGWFLSTRRSMSLHGSVEVFELFGGGGMHTASGILLTSRAERALLQSHFMDLGHTEYYPGCPNHSRPTGLVHTLTSLRPM